MISVCFITKNEEKWIGDCIRHLQGLVTEFIVVDTGSTDKTVEIAKSLGAKVHSIEWPHHFAKARNVSLQYATQPWILKIDPDERLSLSDQDKIRKLCESGTKLAYHCLTRAYTNAQTAQIESSYHACTGEFAEFEQGFHGYKQIHYTRLFKNIPGVAYSGVVHESIDPSLPKLSKHKDPIGTDHSIIFHHYGVDPEAVAEKAKSPMYRALMEVEVEENPKNWYVWYELGLLHFQEGRLEEAELTFRNAFEAEQDRPQPQVLANWGFCLHRLGMLEEARGILKICTHLHPKFATGWVNLAALELSAGHGEQAKAHAEQAIILDSSATSAYRILGQCLAHKGQFEDSEKILQAALRLQPGFLDVEVDLGILYYHQRRFADAEKIFSKTLTSDPNNERAIYFLNETRTKQSSISS